ncbi:ribonuclease H family protein [Methanobrevibacter millerae]|uniref:ribonuclease H n=1 Tax=Methanobrevibacter millerae TaxID=230361 RepID=A0A1G5UVQ2_9EURY|nr:ribonuclease H [Methanobrevibacter millerae]SDA37388.1 ribonuclease HI [Methanobrevibacter millerae]
MPDKYTYYTDGAATMKRQKGQYVREAGGWAFVLLIDGNEDSSQSGGCPLTTNNEMELYAIYASMKDFLSKCSPQDSVEICSDSSYCIDIYTKWARNWQRRGWRKSDGKPIKNLEIIKATWKLMAQIKDKSCNLKFVKVRGHSNNKLNIKADRLAVDAKAAAFKTGKTVGYNNKKDSLLGGKSKYAN